MADLRTTDNKQVRVTPGYFDRPVVIQAPIDTDDNQGGQARTWFPPTTYWANVNVLPKHAGDRPFADQKNPTQYATISIRWRPNAPGNKSRILVDGQPYYVYQSVNVGRQNIVIDYLCTDYQEPGAQ